jgi:hypothetical protein
MIGRIIKLTVIVFLISLFAFIVVQGFSKEAALPVTEGSTAAAAAIEYLAADAFSPERLKEGKAVFEEKCAVCHSDSGRDMVYFGDPDFNPARVIGSVKKFAGASDDPEIGEKVYEYLRYYNDGAFMSQDEPFLQPGPRGLEPGVNNPILSRGEDFWGSLTGHRIPTPDDINIDKIWDSYDLTQVIIPFKVTSWAEYMPNAVPLPAAVAEIRNLFNRQGYDLNNLPLPDKGLGLMFNFGVNSIYEKYQFSSHSFTKADHSKDFLEAMYSTSLVKWLAVLDFEYGLSQRVNNSWNGKWEFGPYENTILWGPGSNLEYINSFAINPFETILSRERMRNEWSHYSLMFVTGKRGNLMPSTFFHYGTMPWGCKMYDAGLFAGPDLQLFIGLKGFADFWNHSKQYPGKSYMGTQSIPHYGLETRRFLTAFYWPYYSFINYPYDKRTVLNPFLELIYRQWLASIGATENELRNFRTDTYNMPLQNRDEERYRVLVQAYESLAPVMSEEQKDFVKAYIRRIYPEHPSGYAAPFRPYKWELVDPAPQKPVILPFGSDTAYAGKPYVLRILRAQAKEGDIEITAANLPDGARLVKTEGSWESDDYEYSLVWTPAQEQAGKSYQVKLLVKSNMGTSELSVQVKVAAEEEPVVLDDIPDYSVYVGQELCFPLTVQNYHAEKLEFSLEGNFGEVMNNAWNTAGIYTVTPGEDDVGTHTVTFTVKDRLGRTASKKAKITVLPNSKPEIKITPTGSGPGNNKNIYSVKAGETLTLTIEAFDADGDQLEISKTTEFPGYIFGNVYSYTVEEDMAKYFPGPNVLTFKVKDLAPGSAPWNPKYKGGEAKSVLLVYFEPKEASPNHTPWASTGPPQTVRSGQKVTLDGSASDDTDGDPIKFKWTQVSGPKVKLSGASTATPTFTAPKTNEPVILKFYLTVTDPDGLSDSNVARVLVNP